MTDIMLRRCESRSEDHGKHPAMVMGLIVYTEEDESSEDAAQALPARSQLGSRKRSRKGGGRSQGESDSGKHRGRPRLGSNPQVVTAADVNLSVCWS